MENTDLFLNRYHNHIQTAGFGVPAQQDLANSKVLVVGAGDLATPIVSYLTSMGVGHLGIVSNTIIQQKDLPSQPIYFNNHEGKQKGQVLAMQLREINPAVRVKIYDQKLGNDNVLAIVTEYDLVIYASQSSSQSLLFNDACILLKKPLIFGKLAFPTGYLGVFNYKGGATLRCCMQQHNTANIMSKPNDSGISILAGITGCLMANEAIKVITQLGDVAANKLLAINSYNNRLDSLKVEPLAENQSISTLLPDYEAEPGAAASKPSAVRSISPQLLATKIKYKEALQLIDIREIHQKPEENAWNYLHIPEHQLLNDLDQIHQDIMVILISEDGESASRLATRLNERNGLDNIYYLDGGMHAWQQQTGTASITYESF